MLLLVPNRPRCSFGEPEIASEFEIRLNSGFSKPAGLEAAKPDATAGEMTAAADTGATATGAITDFGLSSTIRILTKTQSIFLTHLQTQTEIVSSPF